MSDHDTPGHDESVPDPMDRAYAQAEAMLDDAQARAARRARVLAAVAADSVEAETPPARPRAAWGRGGWLIAASVAGLSVLVAQQIRSPAPGVQPPAPLSVAPPASPAPAAAGPAPKAQAPAVLAPVTPPASRAPPSASGAAKAAAPTPAPEQAPAAPAPPPPAPPPLPVPPVEHRIEEPRPPAAARAVAPAAAANSTVSEMVVTAEKRQSPRDEKAEQLRLAAEAGQADEVAALLAKGAAVDLPDEAGDTALMKSVRADHPAAAILLRRHGASLDRRNRAGESARDLAARVGDPELDRALGLKP
ncbi:ankyrin repeat domain-containing protein [Phenylobacterium sp.]|uniref:ankyrin repeat domain-containing protein n=1 Tax=Phenylobacterium sp. TaxID=1871053 RepID=UPI002B98A4A8|nr:ankyrin repeat domain-containing protein [Phenylobacterium sp.]HLZ75644.1 ankyrin repeat domain-containing protein [Phenylobacterium sp.]